MNTDNREIIIPEQAKHAIDEILQRGNTVQIQRSGNSVIVYEIIKMCRYKEKPGK